jgi:hypothetical protein
MQDKRRQNHQKVNHKTYRLFLLAALKTHLHIESTT